MLIDLLANTPPPNGSVSGEILIAVIGAIFSGGALWIGKIIGEKKATATRLEEPVPTVPVRKVAGMVHWYQHEALERRVGVVEADLKEVKHANAAEYVSILEAGQERELRLMEKMDAQTRELHARLDDQFGPRPKKAGGAR